MIQCGAYILVCSAIISLARCCYCMGQEQTCSHYILVKGALLFADAVIRCGDYILV